MAEDTDVGQAALLLYSLLSPDIVARSKRLETGETALVHYTSGSGALSIIRSGEFWLRNVRCMNDHSEVQHGVRLIINTFLADGSKRRDRLISLGDKIAPGAAAAAIGSFDQWKEHLPEGAFIGCLSEHDPADDLGRLSMWRAYSSGSGVALVLNKTPFVAETNELKAYTVPVLYFSDTEFAAAIDRSLDSIEASLEQLSALPKETLRHILFWWLTFLSVSLKHRAFQEEREWRVIYLPNLDRSPVILENVEPVNGIPQLVQKIPLRNAPHQGLHGADIPSLLDRIIIGPSEFPLVIRDALIAAMRDAHVIEPADKVRISWIPLRA